MHANPYLSFGGECAEAFRFYETVFGGDLTLMTWRGSPMEAQTTPEMLDRVMHARLASASMTLMGGDAPPGRFRPMQGMWVSVSVDDLDAARRLWASLSDGGQVVMPLEATFWALAFGMATDRFGTPWMINCEKPGWQPGAET